MALTATRRAIYMIMRKGRQVAPLRIQFLVKNLASTLGFLEFITEDELQEHAGNPSGESSSPRALDTKSTGKWYGRASRMKKT